MTTGTQPLDSLPQPCYITFVAENIMSTIKVQIIGGVSTKSAIESGFDATQHPLTFHAYSDTMKARILESCLRSPGKIVLSFTNDTPRDGEWHEPIVENAVTL